MEKRKEFIADMKAYIQYKLGVDCYEDYRFFRTTSGFKNAIAEEIPKEFIIKRFLENHPVLTVDLIHWFSRLAEEYYGVFLGYEDIINILFKGESANNRTYWRGWSYIDTPYREKQKYNKNKSRSLKKTKEQKQKENWRKSKIKGKDKQKSWKKGYKAHTIKYGHRAVRQDVRKKLKKGEHDDFLDFDIAADPWSWN